MGRAASASIRNSASAAAPPAAGPPNAIAYADARSALQFVAVLPGNLHMCCNVTCAFDEAWKETKKVAI